jgi:hypothetical protein
MVMFSRRLMGLALFGFAMSLAVGTSAFAINLEKFEGKVFSVTEKSVTVGTDEDQHGFIMNQDTKITLDGNPVRWADLKFGYSATVFAMRHGDNWVAHEIAAYANE